MATGFPVVFPQPLRLGALVVDPPLLLAPMAGVTDAAYRHMMAEHGAGLVTTEMVSAEGLLRGRQAVRKTLSGDPPGKRPLAVQLFGAKPDVMAEAARRVEAGGAALIDINAGCPVRKVAAQGAGAILLTDPEALARLVAAVRKAVSIPVTVKIRLGWNRQAITVLDVAQRLAAAGADAITLHARTASDLYAGHAEWGWIGRLKRLIAIPVIGNGDVRSPDLAERMFRETACDGVMIGRASLGNPWIFAVSAARWGKPPANRTFGWGDFYETVLEHVDRALEHHGHPAVQKGAGRRPATLLRRLLGWYVAGCPGAARLRREMMQLERGDALLELLRVAVDRWQMRGVPFLPLKTGDAASRRGESPVGRWPEDPTPLIWPA